MHSETIGAEPGLERSAGGDATRLTAHGSWTIDNVGALERSIEGTDAVRVSLVHP